MKIVLIGSGNVATQLGPALKKHHRIIQVVSKKHDNASLLAKKLNATATDNISRISPGADLYILAVNDDALEYLISRMPGTNGIVVHTAGSVAMDVLDRFRNHGVFYPFQTFSKSRDIPFDQVPVLVEGNNNFVLTQLKKLASSITEKSYTVSSAQRLMLHVAAVFSCNFVNHFYHIAETVLNKAGLPFELLKPLVEETAAKAFTASPSEVQTGPAVRDDRLTLQKHIDILKNSFPESNLAELYESISEMILKTFHEKDQ